MLFFIHATVSVLITHLTIYIITEFLKLKEQKRKIANFLRMTNQNIEMLSAEDRHLMKSTLNIRREMYREKLGIINAKKKEKLFNMLKVVLFYLI